MKELYEAPEMEVVAIDEADIIFASTDNCPGNSNNPGQAE